METNNEIIAALDIGTTKIVALAGRKTSDNKFEILAFGTTPSYGMRRGIVINIDETVNSIRQAVRKAEDSANLKFNEVYVGIAGQHVLTKTNTASLQIEDNDKIIKEKHIDLLEDMILNSVFDPGEEIINIIPQSYIVDKVTGIENPIGMSGSVLQGNFQIISGQMQMVNNIKKCVTLANLKIKSLILEPIASSEAVLTKQERESNVAVLDIGGGTTDLAIFKSNLIIKTAVIPLGGNIITTDISNKLGLIEKQAEKLKVVYGTAIEEKSHDDTILSIEVFKGHQEKEFSLRELSKIISSRITEILFAVKFQIENTEIRDKLTAGMVITGGGSLTSNLKQLASYVLGTDIRIGYPNSYIVGEFAEEINKPQFSTAVGLIIKGVELSEQEEEEIKKLDEINKKLNEDLINNNENQEKSEENVKKKEKKSKENKGSRFNNILSKMANLFDEEETDNTDKN